MSYAKRTFLVTGATGFLGGAITVAALRAGYGKWLLLLARPSKDASPRQRLMENLRRLGATEPELRSLREDFILEGDLAAPHTFKDHPQLQAVERVVHAAALPTFSNNPAVPAVNVEGTLALAHALNHKRLKRFLFVGTAMAVGPSLGHGAFIEESAHLAPQDDHLVAYTASKAEAERRLRLELPSLPLLIARPSIVVGHTALGVSPSQSIFWVFLVGQMLGAFTCDLNDLIDVIPVDWCANALLTLAMRDALGHDLYHVSAGKESSVTFGALDKVLAAARRVAPMGDSYRKIRGSEIVTMMPQLRQIAPGANRRLLLRAMRLYAGFAQLNYVFDNNRLRREGLAASPPLTSYLSRCVDTARDISIADQMKWDFK
jgi:nucleoside-diphosphate-sugar epimerase